MRYKFLANWFRRHLSLKREERREVRIRRFGKVASMNLPSLADERAFFTSIETQGDECAGH